MAGAKDPESEAPVALPAWTGVRVQPSVPIALGAYAAYLAVFFLVWIINDVDYPTIGDTVESTKLHYAMPTLAGSAVLLVLITRLGWWRIALFDSERSGPRWAWIGPIGMFALAVGAFTITDWDEASGSLILWSALGAIGVGFGEEMITRGALLVGLRVHHTEARAWLLSTLAFSALHVPNVLFGQAGGATAAQVVLTFILGSLLWAARRLSGTLLLPMFLHGFWDSSVFLPDATGADPFSPSLLLYPLAIAVTVAVVRRNRDVVVR
jgi:membrane protease YdiL (CAAX protease family)